MSGAPGRCQVNGALLGVLGGMGPAATADFYAKLVKATPADCDQDHIPVILIADPRIADRSQAIESGEGREVLAAMLQRLRYLESAGVSAIALPCNTAHFWLPGLRAHTHIPFISLVEASAREARRRSPQGTRALVLGTRGTIKSRVYDVELQGVGFGVRYPRNEDQVIVDSVIGAVKAGDLHHAAKKFEGAARSWVNEADVVLLACTELPLAAPNLRLVSRLVDTTAALAKACVAWARTGNQEWRHPGAPR